MCRTHPQILELNGRAVMTMTRGVVATVFVVLGAVPVFAQSDTAEIRAADVGRDVKSLGSSEDFGDRKAAMRANIELWEDRVEAKIEKLVKSLQGLDLKKIQNQKITVDELQSILDELDEEAQAILNAHGQLGPDLKNLREALSKAPAVFRAIGEKLAKRASETKSQELKEAYADFASEAQALAVTYEKRSAGAGNLDKDLAKKMELVKDSRVFITDVREFLDAVPTTHGIPTEKLIERINKYIAVFEDTIRTIKGVSERIGEEESPSRGPTKTPKDPPLTRTSPRAEPPTNLVEFRERLERLKR
jgi:ribosomal protein L10